MSEQKSYTLRRGLMVAVILVMSGFIAFGRLQRDGWAFNEYDAEMHIAAFVVLTILTLIAFPRAALSRLFFGLLALGGILELLQALPGINRQASLSDFAFNVVGIGIAISAIALLRWIRKGHINLFSRWS